MASEKPVDTGVLPMWKAKYAALGRLIEVYEEAERIGALGGVFDPAEMTATTTGAPPRAPMDLPVGVFRDKSIKEAIVIYLGAGRRKQTNKEIATGLQKGGIATTATNFEATVATALYRLKEEGTIYRFPDGWDLAASYPDNLRGRLEKDTKPKRNANPKKKRATASEKRRASQAKGHEPKAKRQLGGTLDARILEFLSAVAPKQYSPKDVGVAVSETDANRLSLAFARLTRYGKVAKSNEGLYRTAAA